MINKKEYQVVKEAMDIHAANVSVMFSNWIFNNGYYRDDRDVWYDRSGEGVEQSTNDLYVKFFNEITSIK